ncbi:MAG: hypothetical protein AB1606_06065 [Nitrospirota bacterium]
MVSRPLRKSYLFSVLIIPIIMIILPATISFADADRILRKTARLLLLSLPMTKMASQLVREVGLL